MSPSGRGFAVSKDKAVTVMDGVTGNVLTSWQQDDSIEGLALSHDGKTVLTYNYEGVQFQDSRSGAVSQPSMRTSQARTFDLFASPKQSIFATDGDDRREVWNAALPLPFKTSAAGWSGFFPMEC